MQLKTFKLFGMWLFASLFASLLAACSPEISHRGYIPKEGAFEQLRVGISKMEVEGILGSPTTTASINIQGDSYYYVSYITEKRSILPTVELDRKVIAVRFDKSEMVSGMAEYGLKDGRIINMNTRKSPVEGSEFSLLKELFKGVGGTTAGAGDKLLSGKL